jgi:hypothetical protein
VDVKEIKRSGVAIGDRILRAARPADQDGHDAKAEEGATKASPCGRSTGWFCPHSSLAL